jgi:hypothetical protein
VSLATPLFPCQQMDFLIKYLSIPLSFTKLPKSALQHLVDRVADRLPVWKGWLLHRRGRPVLIKTTLFAILVYTSISIGLPPWMHKALQKIMTAFLWTNTDMVQGGNASLHRSVSNILSIWGFRDLGPQAASCVTY